MPRRPNIVIFNPDQWRGDVLGHAGNPAACTPNLDALVSAEAVSFTNAFCQNPVCTPSRCSFLTGWYPHVRGHRTMFHMLRANHGETNLLRLLRQNGYHVWWGGKNDLIPGQDGFANDCDVKFRPTPQDFERWGCQPRRDLHSAAEWRGAEDSDTYYSFYAGRLDKGSDPIYCDNDWAMVLGAIDAIRNHTGDQPLCIYLPLSYPHPPYGVEEPYFSMIHRAALPPRAPTPEGWRDKPALLKGIWERQHMQNWSEERWTELRATYYGMCARLDTQLGLLMSALRDAGLWDDTALFLFSDHGDFTGDYGLVEKTQNTFEDCLTHVPFIIKPPAHIGVSPGIRDALVELVDFSATVFDLTDIQPGYTHFGKSLLPLVTGETQVHRDAVFCEGGRLTGETQAMELESVSSQVPSGLYYPRVGLQSRDDVPYHSKATMCRTAEYKYVRRLYELDELYDLARDPQELRNVIDDPAYAGVAISMRERMLTWYQETCDVVPFDTDMR